MAQDKNGSRPYSEAIMVAGSGKATRPLQLSSQETQQALWQILCVLDFSSPQRLEERSRTVQPRVLAHLIGLHDADFCDLSTGDRVEECRGGFGVLREYPYWRLLPYGCWVEVDGGVVIFDRSYSPIARLKFPTKPVIVSPRERIQWQECRRIYEEANAPYLDPGVLTDLDFVVLICELGDEIRYRQRLSDYGRRPWEDWTKDWRPQP